VQAGKIRHIGLSNETPWGVMRFLHYAETKNLPRVHSIQNAYNLLNRTFELGLAEIAMREQVGLLAYSPLAQGYLTGKYQKGALPPGSRKQLFQRLGRYEVAGTEELIDKYLALALELGLDAGQMAIRFVTEQKFVTSNIIGATTLEQLKIDLGSQDIAWDKATGEAINAIHLQTPNLCP
jgi:aryl-alcohol dehydrogenase-like predicted oxidoreductase